MPLKRHDIQKFIDETSQDIFTTLRLSAQLNSMVMGGAPDESRPNQLTLRTGTTLRALLGTGSGNRADSIAIAETSGDGFSLTYGVNLPWAAKQEIGGTFAVKEGNRRFFWAKYFNTTDPTKKLKWKMMALFAKTLTYPARPFLLPTVTNPDTINKIAQHIYDYLGDVILFNFQLMVDGAKKGDSFNRTVAR